MTIIIIAAAFVVVAILVVLVAMRSGPNRGPQPAGGNAGFTLVMLALFLFGLGVPAYAIIDDADSRSKDTDAGVRLSESASTGRELFRQNCATCHALADAGAAGVTGPNLDELRPPKELVLNAIKLGRARGQGQMPAGLLRGTDAEDVAEYVAAVAGR